mmetsp:Transcript_5476/g.17625  ORF Transcript_5476/g.17625 Transcript_5476/m.17625 type:complete len:211 (-) Transcript_5476:73-705(-)
MTKARRSLPRVPPGAHASDLAARRRARVHVLRRQRGRRRHRLGVGRGAPTRCKEPFFAKAPPLSGTWMPIRPPSRTAAAGWRSSATTATASRASRSSSPSSCTPTPLGRRRPTPIRSSCSLREASACSSSRGRAGACFCSRTRCTALLRRRRRRAGRAIRWCGSCSSYPRRRAPWAGLWAGRRRQSAGPSGGLLSHSGDGRALAAALLLE